MTQEGRGGDKTRRRQTRRSRNKMRRNRSRKKDRRRTRMKIKNILFLMPCRLSDHISAGRGQREEEGRGQ